MAVIELTETSEILVPDLGDIKDVPVIEVLARVGDDVQVDQTLIVLETEKATMDVPSTAAGKVREVLVKVGDKVNQGSVLVLLEPAGPASSASPVGPASSASPAGPASSASPAGPASSASKNAPAPQAAMPAPALPSVPQQVIAPPAPTAPIEAAAPAIPQVPPQQPQAADAPLPHASPSIRRFARELGVDLTQVSGTGPKGRILHSDIQAFVKAAVSQARPEASPTTSSLNLLPWPQIDFSKFGPVERAPLSKIKKISAANLLRNSILIPHVTNFDEADITDLEAFRVDVNKTARDKATKLTMLAFLIKASVTALRLHPHFNASLSPEADELILKRYFHIGFAADTPNGLVVPVIRDADTKGLIAIAAEAGVLAAQAREGKLKPADMQGGCFTVSSLGGIGGTGFTPIINAPEVAILGAARGAVKPVWNGATFAPRTVLPLSLSWDHRVIDGAAAARFLVSLTALLADFRRVLL